MVLTMHDFTNKTIDIRRELEDGALKTNRTVIGCKLIWERSSLLLLLPHKVKMLPTCGLRELV